MHDLCLATLTWDYVLAMHLLPLLPDAPQSHPLHIHTHADINASCISRPVVTQHTLHDTHVHMQAGYLQAHSPVININVEVARIWDQALGSGLNLHPTHPELQVTAKQQKAKGWMLLLGLAGCVCACMCVCVCACVCVCVCVCVCAHAWM